MSGQPTNCILITILSSCLALAPARAQEKQTAKEGGAQSPPPARAVQTPKPALAFGLEDGTPVKLRLTRDLSSATEKAGATVDFEVIEEVKAGNAVVIARGALALGTVVEAVPKRRMGRTGKLSVRINTVRLASGEKAALRAVREGSDGSRVGTVTTAVVVSGILFFPAAPLFLFMRGKDINVPKGTLVTAYVDGDLPLDPAKFSSQPAGASPLVTAQIADTEAKLSGLVVKSTPEGAEVSVDGKYIGNTPSTLRLVAGEHRVSVQKSGFKPWQRVVTLSPGAGITIEAELEKVP